MPVPSQTPSTPVSSDAAAFGDSPSLPFDPDTSQRARTLETLKAKMVGIQLHFDPGKQTKIGAREMQLLKSEELVDASVTTLTQREAHAIVSQEIADIDEEIESLRRGQP